MVKNMAETSDLHTSSFVALIVGGILILVGALMSVFMMGSWGAWPWMSMSGMMGGYMTNYGGDGWTGMAWWMGAWGAITGSLVLLAATRIRAERDTLTWGIIAIVAGALSLFAMGGFVVGAIAAIVGGALALMQPRSPALPRSE